MDHTIIAARLTAACTALRAKGYERPDVALVFRGETEPFAKGPWCVLRVGSTTKSYQNGYEHPTIEDALAEVDAAAERAPRLWSADDVAATLGLPIVAPCSLCAERPATTRLHDEYEAVTWNVPNPRVCEPCLESARDREQERKSEG